MVSNYVSLSILLRMKHVDEPIAIPHWDLTRIIALIRVV